VRMVLTYTEEIATAAHRHPAIVSLRVGVKNDGTLTAVDGKVTFAGGAYAAWKANPEITVLGATRLASYYRIPAIRIETICAYTNQVPCTQTRTPGSPQIVFAVESQMGQIARAMGIDPADFRLRNLAVPGDTSPLGAKWDGILARETLEKAVEASGWRTGSPGPNRGRGIALYERGAGGGNAEAGIDLHEDGTVTVLCGVPDVGPGIHTAITQIVSETLGIEPESVRIRVEDTDNSPWDPGTGGSKSTNTTGHAAHKAAREVHEQLVACAARKLGCEPDQVGRVDGRFASPEGGELSFAEVAQAAIAEAGGSFHHDTVFAPEGQPPITSFAAQIAEVEVDPETGQVTVTRMTTAHDSGRILNHLTFQGQIDGGVVNGVGFALMEDNPMSDGKITTLNLGDFKLPCAKDIPKLDTVFVDQGEGPVPFQGKAIGELPNVPTAAAIANAVADAIGARVCELPLTAEKVYAALHES